MKRLVVVPSDRIADYERAGYENLDRYYNPARVFDEVYALSPLEDGERQAHGMTIRGVDDAGFRGALNELKPDVVRAYGGYWPSDFVCRNREPGVPVIVSVHDTNPDLLHRSVRYADIVICVSEAVGTAVRQRGVEASRIRLLPNRVDLGVFRSRRGEPGLEELNRRFAPGRRVLHVGRKSEQKNLDTLIRALAQLPVEYSVIFIGLGDAGPYQRLAAEVGVAERCHWVESVKNTELPLWYSWCDCMCTPSRWEGFGIVFIEAAACGTPIVTSDIAPMNEYLKDGESASLVRDPEDPETLAAAVRRACEDAAYREKICAGALGACRAFERGRVDAEEAQIYREAGPLGGLSPLRRVEWLLWKNLGGGSGG